MEDNFFSRLNKGVENIVPLALEKFKIDQGEARWQAENAIRQSQLDMQKQEFAQKVDNIKKENDLKQGLLKMFSPQTVTEDVNIPKTSPTFPGNVLNTAPRTDFVRIIPKNNEQPLLPVGNGMEKQTTTREIQPNPSKMDFIKTYLNAGFMPPAEMMQSLYMGATKNTSDIAKKLHDIYGDAYLNMSPEDKLKKLSELSQIENQAKQDVANPNVQFVNARTSELMKLGLSKETATIKATKELNDMEIKKAQAGRSIIGGGGFVNMPQQDKDTWFEQYRLTNKMPPFAYRDAASRDAFTKGYAEYLRVQGYDPTSAVVSKVVLDGQKSAYRELEKRDTLQKTFINKIEENSRTVENIAKKYGNNWNRIINLPVNKANQIMGSGDFAALKLALKSTSNEIAKVESGSLGIAEVSATQAEFMHKIHDENLSVGEMIKVLEMGKELGRNANVAIGQQKSELIKEMGGKSRQGEKEPSGQIGNKSTDFRKKYNY